MNYQKLKEILEDSAKILEEVRTGSDFEVECWERAEKIRDQIKILNNENKNPPLRAEMLHHGR